MGGHDWLASPWVVPALVGAGTVALGLLALVLTTPVYKHIICTRYLFAGWKAVVPLISALPAALGVFLLILVFAIMDGFVQETREMTRGTLSDVIVDAHLEGLPYYDDFIHRIEKLDGVETATPIIQTYAVARIKPHREEFQMVEVLVKPVVRPCLLIGIRPGEKARMGRFTDHLVRQKETSLPDRVLQMPEEWRKPGESQAACIAGVGLIGIPRAEEKTEDVSKGADWQVLLFFLSGVAAVTFLLLLQAARRHPGHRGWRVAAIVGAASLVCLSGAAVFFPVTPEKVLRTEVNDFPLIDYGDGLVVSTIPIRPSGAMETEAGGVPKVSTRVFTLVDAFKSGFWEADSTHVYIDFKVAQQMAGMEGSPAADGRPSSPARASQVQVKIKDPAQGPAIREKVRAAWRQFAAERPEIGFIQVQFNTWMDQQKMILTVVEVERNITALMLGVMLLGFGVLIALISYVMAYIKSRDVGILKAVGARDAGVGSLFLGYGFIIGLIGTALGMTAALLMIHYLDPIEIWVNSTLGINVFPREMYYFEKIPRNLSVAWCITVGGAVLALSTLASMAGGLLAALKQPVETLRYE